MAYKLIGNGRHLYKYNRHLLRTPLQKSISLNASEMAYYDVAGSYRSSMPTSGVIDTTGQNLYTRMIRSGKYMRNYYLGNGILPGPQIWRVVNQGVQPEFIFYQGSFSPSASSYAGGYENAEAFMKIPAYKFEIPEKYKDFNVSSAQLLITHGGSIIQKGFASQIQSGADNIPYFVDDAPTRFLPSNNDWRYPWQVNLGVYNSIVGTDPVNMYRNATQSITLDNLRTDGYINEGVRSSRVIWDNTYVDYHNGAIPVTTSPWVQTISLNSSTIDRINSLRGGWIVITCDVGVGGSMDSDGAYDYPWYSSGDNPGRWLCVSFWGYALKLTLEI